MGHRNTKNYIEISMFLNQVYLGKVSISLENDPFCEVNFQKKNTTYGQFHERKKA